MTEIPRTLADAPPPDELTCRRLLALLSTSEVSADAEAA